MKHVYFLLIGGMVCLFLAFYFLGIRPLATLLFDSQKERIVFDLDRVGWTFNNIVERHKQLAMQTASRTAIRKKQISFLEGNVPEDEFIAFSKPKLADALQANGEMIGIARYTPSGDFLFSIGEHIPIQITQRCKKQMEVEEISVIPSIADTQSQSFFYCSSIIDKEYGVAGFDIIRMSDQVVRDFVNENLSPIAVYVLVSDTGELLYWPDKLMDASPLDALKQYLHNKTPRQSYIIKKFNTNMSDLTIYVVVDQDSFTEPVRNQLSQLLIVLAVFSIIIFIVTIILTRPVIRSLLAEQRMRELTRKDLLSGLYNRRVINDLFVAEIARAKRYKHPLAVIMFDIDHFKKVNDTYGHPAGDEVIRTVGSYCLESSRQSDFWIRYGGEEFLGVFPETNAEEVAVFAERLRSGLEQTAVKTSKGTLSFTVSGGYASFLLNENSEIEPANMIDLVDQALYEAKRSGRNKILQQT